MAEHAEMFMPDNRTVADDEAERALEAKLAKLCALADHLAASSRYADIAAEAGAIADDVRAVLADDWAEAARLAVRRSAVHRIDAPRLRRAPRRRRARASARSSARGSPGDDGEPPVSDIEIAEWRKYYRTRPWISWALALGAPLSEPLSTAEDAIEAVARELRGRRQS